MESKVLGIVRYSVISETGSAWRVGKQNDFEAYKAKILDLDRLTQRLELFSRVTLPSIGGQSITPDKSWFKLIVLVSDALPKAHDEALRACLAEYPFCEVVPVGTEKKAMDVAIGQSVKKFCDSELYSTFRIDDDDALSNDYLERLLSYTRSTYEGHAVSFPRGLQGVYDFKVGRFTHLGTLNEPKIALGLAFVAGKDTKYRHVFDLGNHTAIDQRVPVVLDGSGTSYIRTWHESGDIVSVIDEKERLAKMAARIKDPVEPASVVSTFSLSSDVL